MVNVVRKQALFCGLKNRQLLGNYFLRLKERVCAWREGPPRRDETAPKMGHPADSLFCTQGDQRFDACRTACRHGTCR